VKVSKRRKSREGYKIQGVSRWKLYLKLAKCCPGSKAVYVLWIYGLLDLKGSIHDGGVKP